MYAKVCLAPSNSYSIANNVEEQDVRSHDAEGYSIKSTV